MTDYSEAFYLRNESRSRGSAEQILPYVCELMQPHVPRSVVDFGCGLGTWLSVFKEHGVEDIVGVDGDWVKRDNLLILESEFVASNFAASTQLGRTFDLVISMEVAEHIPPNSAELFIDMLTSHGDIVLFSAAVPFQGGLSHVNEQWPVYWADLFKAKGYLTIDCLRGKFWNNMQVDWWYAQNSLLFVREEQLSRYPRLQDLRKDNSDPPRSLIHPTRYLTYAQKSKPKYILKRTLLKMARGLGVEHKLKAYLQERFPFAKTLNRLFSKGRNYGGLEGD